MLPVLVPAFCCTVFSLCLVASSALQSSKGSMKHTVTPFCRCAGARPSQFSRMLREHRALKRICKENVVGSGLSPRETNSSWQGFILWGVSQSSAPARWRPQRRTRHGRHSRWERHSLASRCRRTRQNPHPRALRFSAKKTPRIRRRKDYRIARRPESSPLESR